MEYFDTLPVEMGKHEEFLCKEMHLCLGDTEPRLSLRSKLYQGEEPYNSFRNGYDVWR